MRLLAFRTVFITFAKCTAESCSYFGNSPLQYTSHSTDFNVKMKIKKRIRTKRNQNAMKVEHRKEIKLKSV